MGGLDLIRLDVDPAALKGDEPVLAIGEVEPGGVEPEVEAVTAVELFLSYEVADRVELLDPERCGALLQPILGVDPEQTGAAVTVVDLRYFAAAARKLDQVTDLEATVAVSHWHATVWSSCYVLWREQLLAESGLTRHQSNMKLAGVGFVGSYLLRVGLDGTAAGGRGLAPIYWDGTFDYIPIPEQCDSSETRTYRDLQTRGGGSASEYAGVDPETPLHYDPEFETYTYGEVGSKKCASLRKMDPGDLLVFCAGLNPAGDEDRPRMFAIGYLTVSEVNDLEEMSPGEREDVLSRHSNNAHAKRTGVDPDRLHHGDESRTRYPVIVAGDPERSRLLDRGVPLSSSTATGTDHSWYRKYRPLGSAESVLGLNATDLKRSNPKKIRSPPREVRAWLDGDVTPEVAGRTAPDVYDRPLGAVEASGEPELRSYVIKTDSGFAPHVRDGVLSLATCKPTIRSASQPGDWVAAVTGSGADSDRRLVHAFRIERIVNMNEYFTNDLFESRVPLAGNDNPEGDNIYAPREAVSDIESVRGDELPSDAGADGHGGYERGWVHGELCYTHPNGEYFQLAGGGHSLRNYRTDVEKQGDRENVLLSSEYYYFGDSAPEIPEDVARTSVPGYGSNDSRRALRCERGPEEIEPFVRWLRSNFRPGQHGHPRDSSTELDPSDTSGPGC